MKELIDLYLAFLRIGLVNFGGGYAMLPLLERDLADTRGWVTVDELMDYYAIGQCTPGLIALNVATFIGNKRKGVAGGIIATLVFLTCPIVIILIIAMFPGLRMRAHIAGCTEALEEVGSGCDDIAALSDHFLTYGLLISAPRLYPGICYGHRGRRVRHFFRKRG